MAKHTKRDKLWSFALKATQRSEEAISADKLATMAQTSEKSARDVLITMEDMGFLQIDKNGREVRYLPDETVFEPET